MKWKREGSVIHIELEASDFGEPRPVIDWVPSAGMTLIADVDGRLTGATFDV